ncbi:hypothetical protein ASC66_04225 [Leifsonia sp. Root4]|nr:hypothetical protein ASC66_04225 [Leifsonia sp. Root4]
MQIPPDNSWGFMLASALSELDPEGAVVGFEPGVPGPSMRRPVRTHARLNSIDPDSATMSDYVYPDRIWLLDESGRLGYNHRLEFHSRKTTILRRASNATDAGYNQEDFSDLLVTRSEGGFGGDSVWYDIASFLLDQGVQIGLDATVGGIAAWSVRRIGIRIAGSKSDKRARRTAREWEARGIGTPARLREFLELNAAWHLEEVCTRLDIAPLSGAQLLQALGYELRSDGSMLWQLGHHKSARKRREKWMKAETAEWQPELRA